MKPMPSNEVTVRVAGRPQTKHSTDSSGEESTLSSSLSVITELDAFKSYSRPGSSLARVLSIARSLLAELEQAKRERDEAREEADALDNRLDAANLRLAALGEKTV